MTTIPAPIQYEPTIDPSIYTLGKQLVTDKRVGARCTPIYERGVLLAFLGMPGL